MYTIGTCMIGCASDPPSDVAHVQFNSRIAFKLVWAPPLYNRYAISFAHVILYINTIIYPPLYNTHANPPLYNSFVLIDDDGALLGQGSPTGQLPASGDRRRNYSVVQGSKYAVEADKIGASS